MMSAVYVFKAPLPNGCLGMSVEQNSETLLKTDQETWASHFQQNLGLSQTPKSTSDLVQSSALEEGFCRLPRRVLCPAVPCEGAPGLSKGRPCSRCKKIKQSTTSPQWPLCPGVAGEASEHTQEAKPSRGRVDHSANHMNVHLPQMGMAHLACLQHSLHPGDTSCPCLVQWKTVF